jgi:putative ABC transport system permease protein
MFYNFLKIALRNLQKHKLHSFINIFGLAVGMAASILMVSFVFFEKGYDKFHENYADVYRVHSKIYLPNGEAVEGPTTLGNCAPRIKSQIPEILYSVRFMGHRDSEIEYKGKFINNDKLIWADSSFFDVFSFEALDGDLRTALVEENSIVLTESFAKTIFGEEDPFDKTVKRYGENFKVTAVIKNVPVNSHFHFDLLGSFSSICNAQYDVTKENGFNFYTYLVCEDFEKNKNNIETKANELIGEIADERFGGLGLRVESNFQALKDIHLKSNSAFELEANGNLKHIYIFAALALFIILIAIVNFINLVTANAETRAKEIGLRKVLGANRSNLFGQFIGESILTSLFAFVLALGLVELLIDMFRQLMQSPIAIQYWSSPLLFVFLLLIVVLVGFVAGCYPALYLSGFSPARALKGSKSSSGAKNTFLRKSLVVFQFSISIFLLVILSLLYKQVAFMKNKDLGFDKEEVMVVKNFSNTISKSYLSLKADLLTNPNITAVTASEPVPGDLGNIQAVYNIGENPDASVTIHETRVQDDFVKTFGIKIVEGRAFESNSKTEANKVLVNQMAVKKLALENPINRKIVMFEDTLTIVGIMHDFHFQSLHEKIAPQMLTKQKNWFSKISIKLNTKNVSKSLQEIEAAFHKVDPNNVFSYCFMDQKFEQMYQAEERSNALISYAAILAILISMFGLFALTSFTISQKTKEIGLRKVLGASTSQIVKMFLGDLVKWVGIAAVIAFPLAYFAMIKWLENFEYHTSIQLWMFLLGGALAMIIAMATVSFISIRAANANPAESLKYE